MKTRRSPKRSVPLRAAPDAPRPASDDRWSTLFENLEEGILAVDEEGRVTHMNQAAEQLTGCSRASASGRSHRWVFRQSPWVSQLLETVSAGRPGHIRAQGEITIPWGRASLVLASASPLLDARGTGLGAVVALHDLTLQRSLETDQQRAQNLSQFGVLVAGLAHEIKNPLSGIRGAVQLLDVDLERESRGREYVSLVLREVDRLTRLLEHLLDLGSPRPLECVAVNVHRVIDHVLEVTEAAAEREGISVQRLFDPSLPPVAGQPDPLIQVFLNLVQNAIQSLSAAAGETSRREIRVSTRMETEFLVASERPRGSSRNRFIRVEVEDTGPGIPPEVQSSLFSPFFTTKAKGTGLGLAISHRIVSDHRGTIRVESEPGRTVFRVILPCWEEAATSA
jgi:two-component system, NtrC family, nitrogen regulation sensor histidine kinase GlnL